MMNVKPALWILSVLLIGGMVWPAGAPNALANGAAGRSSGCVDDTWMDTRVDAAASARADHTAVWTGSEMIIWGGCPDGDSAVYRYDPATDTWAAISTEGAPSARDAHTAVWTGTEMIVWGGGDDTGFLNTGGRYDPVTNSWVATSMIRAPGARVGHTAVWTGSEMIVWGGCSNVGCRGLFNTGGRYDPATDTWTAINTDGAPSPRSLHAAVAWTGTEMIVWGGLYFDGTRYVYLNTGGRYDPATDTWTAMSTVGAPSARYLHTVVWTGTEMLVWGGVDSGPTYLNTGSRYDPATDTWTAISTDGAPSHRELHTAVWTGTEMIVWGGFGGGAVNTGGRYAPTTDTWTATSTDGAPSARYEHTVVWTGTEMLVWGGFALGPTYFNTGGRYCASAGGQSQR